MSIILNEYEWAEMAIRTKSLGKRPSETLTRVARYYLHTGNKKKDLKKMLESFFMQCEPNASVKRMNGYVEKAIKDSKIRPLAIINEIVVTDKEMEKIDSLGSKQLSRLAFTMLCIAKQSTISGRTKDHWVNERDSDIMRMANINTSIKRQSAMFGQLIGMGLLRRSKQVDNLNTQVMFVEDGEPAVSVKDFRNLGYQYEKYHGGHFFVCQRCGVTERLKNPGVGRPQKYCDSCAAEVALQQRVNSVMRRRSSSEAPVEQVDQKC